MSSHGNNRPTNEKPLLHIDSTTFQATVTAAMTVIMAHLNASNASKNGNDVKNSNCCDNRGNQRVSTCKDTLNHKPSNTKRKFWNEKGGSSNQGSTKRQ